MDMQWWKIKKATACVTFWFADRTRLELATSAVTGRHSNQLNYRSGYSLKRECKAKKTFKSSSFFS